jgi:release factor glutamine methyltransferase
VSDREEQFGIDVATGGALAEVAQQGILISVFARYGGEGQIGCGAMARPLVLPTPREQYERGCASVVPPTVTDRQLGGIRANEPRSGAVFRVIGRRRYRASTPGVRPVAYGVSRRVLGTPLFMTPLLLVRPPGVYRAENDTWLVADVMHRGGFAEGRDVLDMCTGTGALAVVAHRAGARSVTAVDLSRRSVAAAWINGRVHRAPLTLHRGDLFAPVARRRFGLVVANPPYVPAATAVLPRHTKGRCWDAGVDGRAVLDRICAGVADVLAPEGTALIVQSALSGVDATLDALRSGGLTGSVLATARIPFGPVLRGRAALLAARGMIRMGQTIEEIVVIGAGHAG